MVGDLLYILGTTANELGGSEYYDLFGHVGLNVPRLDTAAALTLYGALEQAVASELMASCHGIYRGGLAIHAALMALGGLLGIRLDMGRVPTASPLRDDQILFSESCARFLVTVSPDKQGQFEQLFRGLPFSQIGEIVSEPNLRFVGQDGRTLINTSIQSLKSSWKRPVLRENR
jgi:phosphoribosylformylglycinamidine (FGAM) synthase-like enzyme